MPTWATIRQPLPIWTLCPICTRLSIFVPAPMRVSSKRARSMRCSLRFRRLPQQRQDPDEVLLMAFSNLLEAVPLRPNDHPAFKITRSPIKHLDRILTPGSIRQDSRFEHDPQVTMRTDYRIGLAWKHGFQQRQKGQGKHLRQSWLRGERRPFHEYREKEQVRFFSPKTTDFGQTPRGFFHPDKKLISLGCPS